MGKSYLHGAALFLVVLVGACGRDFELPDDGLAILNIEVTPAHAREGSLVEVSFLVLGTSGDDPNVSLLGFSIPKLSGPGGVGEYVYAYEVLGNEPEGVVVDIDITAEGGGEQAQGTAGVRFDFVPPTISAVESSPVVVGDGELLTMDAEASEALAGLPTTTLAGAACARVNATRFRCVWLADSSEPEGWLFATFEMTDLAGNVGSDTVPLGTALDLGSPLTFDDVVVTPSPATRGMTLEIRFHSSLPVDGNPVVLVADFPAQWTSGPSTAGEYIYSYFVAGVELGGVDPAVGTAPIVISGIDFNDNPGTGTGAVDVDFRAPLVTGEADPPIVSPGDDFTVTFTGDEPIAAISASVQGRSMDCRGTTGAEVKRMCSYQVTGTEVNGPQTVVVLVADILGNTARRNVDAGLEFDLLCEMDVTKVFIATTHARAPQLVAYAGAFDPASVITVSATPGGPPLATTTAKVDGSVNPEALPGYTALTAYVSAVDPEDNVCPPVETRARFRADLDGSGGPNPSFAKTMMVGDPTVHLDVFLLESEFSSADYLFMMVTDLDVFERGGAPEGTPSWVDRDVLPLRPPDSTFSGLSYRPAERRVYSAVLNGPITCLGTDQWCLFGWDGTDYERIGASGGPNRELGFQMVYQSLGDSFFTFGGRQLSGPNDRTWEAPGGGGWIERVVFPRPSAREFYQMAYDDARDEVLLFGGRLPLLGTQYDDTWVWDGDAWTKRNPRPSPPSRERGCMEYDSVRERVVMFGGADAAGNALDDVWEWDGIAWHEMTPPTSPPARILPGMAYSRARRTILIHGGFDDATNYLDDFWEWNGATWQPLTFATMPPAIGQHDLIYDPLRGVIVLSGGYSGGSLFRGLWEYGAERRWRAVEVQLFVQAPFKTPVSGVLQVVARGTGFDDSGSAVQGIDVSAWDPALGNWVRLARDVGDVTAPGVLRTVRVPLTAGQLDRLLVLGEMGVLITPIGSTTTTGATSLAIDSIYLDVEKD